jgi:hypothetical protein
MQQRTAYKSLAFSAAALLIVAFIAFGRTIKWVGHTDLDVRFLVTDADTDQSIPNATIHIRAEPGGFCDDPSQPAFTITTDENGHANHLCSNCMCFGSKGIFEDTFGMHLPSWWLHATATGYSATKPAFLNVPENTRQVQPGNRIATLSVPIRLRKTPDDR